MKRLKNANDNKAVTQKAMTRQELANKLGISKSTLWRKLKKEGIKLPPGLIYPKDVDMIYEALFNRQEKGNEPK